MAGDGKEVPEGGPKTDSVARALDKIGRVLVVISGKGGVGKSTVAVNLALALRSNGASVGLMDIDIHGPTVPRMLSLGPGEVEVTPESKMVPVSYGDGLRVMSMGLLLPDSDRPVVWRGPKKMAAIRQFVEDVEWGELDYLVVDLPPGTGDEPLSIAQLIPGSGAVVVTTPQDIALVQSRKAVTFARLLGMPVVGIVENMSGLDCPHCGKRIDLFGKGGGERAAGELGVPFLGRVPLDPKVVESGEEGEPVVARDPESPGARAFLEMAAMVARTGS